MPLRGRPSSSHRDAFSIIILYFEKERKEGFDNKKSINKPECPPPIDRNVGYLEGTV